MKKHIASALCAVTFLLAMPLITAVSAAEENNKIDATLPSKNVTITVVMPESETNQETQSQVEKAVEMVENPIKVYPCDVAETRENGGRQIVKTYELNANENPEDIPREDFDRDGWTYTLTDILRKETASAESRKHTETVTVHSDTKDLTAILSLLSPTMSFEDEDGYAGTLTLDVASIKVESEGTKTSSFTKTITRQYTNLSANDSSLVPKTVTDGGYTYNLLNVDWQSGNNATVDYNVLPEFYTAVATYTRTGYSTKVTGYVTTAEYSGTLAKLIQGKTIYTAYFMGTENRTPLELSEGLSNSEESESTSNANDENGYIWLIVIVLIAILGGGAFYFWREKLNHAKTETNGNSIAAPGADSDGIGSPDSGR
jgi:hypothetical protein